MFVAGRMFATADEAKAWVEATVAEDARRHFIVIELEGDDPPNPPVIEGTNDGAILIKKPE